mgnify:CR=1 FL=1
MARPALPTRKCPLPCLCAGIEPQKCAAPPETMGRRCFYIGLSRALPLGATTTTAASGGLREELLGQWPARCECNCTKQLLGATTWAVEQSETERVSPLSGNRICHLTFKRGFDHRILFRRGLEIFLVQLHADAVALPHDDRRACTGHADDGGSAQNAGLALDGGIPVLASTVTVLPLATVPAGW